MSDDRASRPSAGDLAPAFDVYEVRQDGDRLIYVGQPRTDPETVEGRLRPLFRQQGYEISLQRGCATRTDSPTVSGSPSSPS